MARQLVFVVGLIGVVLGLEVGEGLLNGAELARVSLRRRKLFTKGGQVAVAGGDLPLQFRYLPLEAVHRVVVLAFGDVPAVRKIDDVHFLFLDRSFKLLEGQGTIGEKSLEKFHVLPPAAVDLAYISAATPRARRPCSYVPAW